MIVLEIVKEWLQTSLHLMVNFKTVYWVQIPEILINKIQGRMMILLRRFTSKLKAGQMRCFLPLHVWMHISAKLCRVMHLTHLWRIDRLIKKENHLAFYVPEVCIWVQISNCNGVASLKPCMAPTKKCYYSLLSSSKKSASQILASHRSGWECFHKCHLSVIIYRVWDIIQKLDCLWWWGRSLNFLH